MGQWYVQAFTSLSVRPSEETGAELAKNGRCTESQSAEAELSARRGLAIPTILPNLRSIQLWNVSM